MWVKLSKDKYQLIEAVADSSRELAQICRVSPKTIQSSQYRHEHGIGGAQEYIRIEDGPENDE